MADTVRTLRHVCVFCGSNLGDRPAFRDAAEHLGRRLAARGIGLVYGGGNVGLMGAIADAVLAAGGEVVGVIPAVLRDREVAHEDVTRLEVVDSMHTRKQRMNELSDAFVALPGGYGTLEELLETVTWIQLGMHAKPCGVLDVDGYWQPLLAQLDQAAERGFLRPQYRELLLADDDADRLLDRFERVELPALPRWISREQV